MILDPILAIYIASSIVVLLVLWIVRLEIKLKRLLGGSSAKSLEETLTHTHKNVADLTRFKDESITYFKQIETRLGRSMQAVETVRFNPFKGSGEGGNQSFSTAFVSEKGDGVVISSLYSRERVSVFSKPLKKFGSDFELTEEEHEVVTNAQKHLS
ncbi:MAG: DUF4446 family protein [Patescibacteria group bacterium]